MTTTQKGLTRLTYLCLAIAGACFFTLTSLSSPALADDTDGGSAQGQPGAISDGCVKSGWRLVNNVDDIVWEDNGADRECGNTAYGNRDNANNQEREWTDNEGVYHRCHQTNAARRVACTGTWNNADTSLYQTLQEMGAGGCYKRTDIHGIWYIQDAGLDGIRSWTNLGIGPDGQYRTVGALKDAIDDKYDTTRTVLVDSGTRGDADWWDVRIRRWMGQDEYDNQLGYYIRNGQTRAQAAASVREDARTALQTTIRDVAGTSPVIFCWYSDISKSVLTCAERMPSGMAWSDYLHPDGVTRDTTGVVDCIRRCPTAQGDYPDPLPHAGEWIPNANSSISPRPATNGDNGVADYCYPPTTVTWHQGGYGSEIPGLGYILQGTHGSNTSATQPYAYVSSVEDGNGGYNSTTKTGNAPGQGQFTASAATKKTAFGAFLDTYCAGSASCSSAQIGDPGSSSYNAFVAAYNAAVAKQATETHAVLDLTAAQQAQVAKGRILNVIERTTYASAEARKLLNRFYIRWVTRTIYYSLSGRERANTTDYGTWGNDTAAHPGFNNETVPDDMRTAYRPTFSDGTTFANAHPDVQKWDHGETVYGSTPKPTGFWQNAVTHCNNQEFSGLNPSGTATGANDTGVLDTGDTSQYYSASAVFKIQDSNYGVASPAVDFTRARWGATTANASAKPAFFDRLCYYPGSAKNPTTMAAKTVGTQGSFKFFRDGERHTLEGTKGSGDSPFFVPDFRGEDRTSSVTTVTGYSAKKSTRSAAEYWTVSYQSYDLTGTTTQTVTDYSRPYYSGNYTEDVSLCDTYTSGPGNWASTNNWAEGGTWNVAPPGSSTANKGGILYGQQWLKCNVRSAAGGPVDRGDGSGNWFKQRNYYLQSVTYPWTTTQTVNTYAWTNHTSTYSTDASATAGYTWCVGAQGGGAGNTRSCSKTKTEAVWTTPAQVAVASCPMADTATERYTDCAPVTRTDSVTTNYNVVQYQNEDPTQVIVTRDPLSTPDATLATFFGLTNSGTTAKLFTETKNDNRTPKSDGVSQSQFAANPTFSSNTVAVASGAYKRLQAKGVWATDKSLPQVLTLAWYFTPNVKSTFAVSNIGFGRPGGLMTYTKGERSTPVRGRVEAMADAMATDDGATLAAHQNQVWASTGTNIEDNLNSPLFYGQDRQASAPFKWSTDPSTMNGHYFTVKFVRATAQ